MNHPSHRSIPNASASIGQDSNWQLALRDALSDNSILADLTLLFVSSGYQEFLPEILKQAWEQANSSLLIGCTSPGIISGEIETLDQPAISALRLVLPGATLRPVRFTTSLVHELLAEPDAFQSRLGLDHTPNGWLIFSDPLQTDAMDLIELLNRSSPSVPVIGGLASPGPNQHRTWVFLNGEVYSAGSVGIAIGGDYELVPLLAHGCEPIGEPWTITDVRNHLITGISNRPAIQVLAETLDSFSLDEVDRLLPNISVGLAANEYQQHFTRGDYLVRTITGVDSSDGGIAIAARPRIGQTLQFHVRDSSTAHLDLVGALAETDLVLNGRIPTGGLVLTCRGREAGMFAQPSHDAQVIARHLANTPLAGIVAAGEIGQVQDKSFLHGFAVSAGLFLPK